MSISSIPRPEITSEDHLEAAMVSEAVRSNIHMDTRVIEVAGLKSQVELDLQDFWGHKNLN